VSEDYKIGELVRFRKKHPCGGSEWRIIRVGMDFKVECTTCDKILMLGRNKFEKAVKERIDEANNS
jgi:hypothetical protein